MALARWLRACELVAVLAVAFLLARALGPARYGSPDSATYLSAAEHLVRGDGYVTSGLDEHGHFAALSCFAPLFSLLIAAHIKLTGATALHALPDILIASFVLYALSCRALLHVLLPAALRHWTWLFTICLICAPGSVICLRGALSDLLGAALALFACADLCAQAGEPASSSRRATLAALRSGALFALAIWARWANLYFVLAACLGAVVCARSLPVWSRVQRALALLASALIFVGPLWLRNVLATGAAMGPRPRS